jgi:hypothetical protein
MAAEMTTRASDVDDNGSTAQQRLSRREPIPAYDNTPLHLRCGSRRCGPASLRCIAPSGCRRATNRNSWRLLSVCFGRPAYASTRSMRTRVRTPGSTPSTARLRLSETCSWECSRRSAALRRQARRLVPLTRRSRPLGTSRTRGAVGEGEFDGSSLARSRRSWRRGSGSAAGRAIRFTPGALRQVRLAARG